MRMLAGHGLLSRGMLLRGHALASSVSPLALFAGGVIGVWFDPSDKVPVDWRRNLLAWTEDFSNSAWLKNSVALTAGVADPAGGTSATTVTASAANVHITQSVAGIGGLQAVPSVWIRRRTGTGAIRMWTASGVATDITTSISGSWSRISLPAAAATSTTYLFLQIAVSGDAIDIWHPQLELGTTSTAYQKITTPEATAAALYPKATLYEDVAGTIPATLPGQPLGLMLDKSKGLVLGPEKKGDGVTAIAGSPVPPPTYDPVTGAGFVYRADASNIGGVRIPASVGVALKIEILKDDGAINVRGTGLAGSILGGFPLGAGQASIIVFPDTGFVYLTAGFNGASSYFTVISARELPGYHATQPVAASRPTLARHPKGGRRNLLDKTEDLANAAWLKTNVTTSGSTITQTAGAGSAYIEQVPFKEKNATVTCWAKVKAGTTGLIGLHFSGDLGYFADDNSDFDVSLGVVVSEGVSVVSTITDVGGGEYIIASTLTTKATGSSLGVRIVGNGPIGSTFEVLETQLELGSVATPYQKVTSQYDVIEAGVPDCWGLMFDGVDDFMVTPAIDLTGTDKVGVFAGVRKLSDAALSTIVETSASSSLNNGTIGLLGPTNTGNADYTFRSKGTGTADVNKNGYAAPVTNVVSGIGDIATDTAILRVNGAQVASASTDQGSGNYGSYPLYIGRRGGTSLPFNGILNELIIAGKLPSAAEITNTETFLNNKMGAF